MRLWQWFRPPRHLQGLFLAVTLSLASALGWLGWHLLEQDRALEGEQIQQRLDYAADLIGAALLRKLTGTDQQLATLVGYPDTLLLSEVNRQCEPLAPGALIVVLDAQGVTPCSSAHLVYYPALPASHEAPDSVFAAGEAAEFRLKDYVKAADIFRKLARSPDPAVRAGAILRLARNLRKAGQPVAALASYDELDRLGSTRVGELPAELLGRQARCVLLAELNRREELEREARSLYENLAAGRWPLTHAAYRFYADEARRWITPAPELEAKEQEATALAGGVESLWQEWQGIRRGEYPAAGRRSLWIHNRSVMVLWHGTPNRLVAWVAGPRFLAQDWFADLEPIIRRQSVRLALVDSDGRRVWGEYLEGAGRKSLRTPSDLQLPWTLQVSSADPARDLAQLAARRRLLLAGLVLVGVLVLLGSYFIARAVTRELEVARLQSDFVAAVSHEFRTPLATLRQLSELLSEKRVAGEERRQQYYDGLRRASERLGRLVENLLDFGRMEAGARQFSMEMLDPADLVRGVAEEFAEQARERGFRIDITTNAHLPRVRGDREALNRALWNLLDNAVKYSPQSNTVWMEALSQPNGVALRVRDEGLGISVHERQRIFQKFARAASADAAGVKGTGLGLAMVEYIVKAHGGEIRLESEPGRGSTFTILLPAAK